MSYLTGDRDRDHSWASATVQDLEPGHYRLLSLVGSAELGHAGLSGIDARESVPCVRRPVSTSATALRARLLLHQGVDRLRPRLRGHAGTSPHRDRRRAPRVADHHRTIPVRIIGLAFDTSSACCSRSPWRRLVPHGQRRDPAGRRAPRSTQCPARGGCREASVARSPAGRPRPPQMRSRPGATTARPRWRDDAIVPWTRPPSTSWARSAGELGLIGASQALALLAGVSREGVAMVGGLFRGLDNEDAMRFSILALDPRDFAAASSGADLTGAPAWASAVPCWPAPSPPPPRRCLRSSPCRGSPRPRTLFPFAIYCLAFGLARRSVWIF